MQNRDQPIVVVDDDPEMNHAVERLLKAAGFSVSTFSSPEQLLRANVHATAACLIFDVHLPGFSGFELHRRLRASDPELPPVIFVTAYDEESSRQKARIAGAVGYFPKPFSGRTLVSTITNAINKRTDDEVDLAVCVHDKLLAGGAPGQIQGTIKHS